MITLEQWNDLKAKALAGDSEAQWEVGDWLSDGITSQDGAVLVRPKARAAVRWFRKSANAGNPAGQIHLGGCFLSGSGVRRDDVEALRWYMRALRQGDPIAAPNIANVYRKRGNHRRAMFWYQRAAASGDGDACVDAGRGYYMGSGARPNPKRAVVYFRKAIASENITTWGREEAMVYLGLAFHDGRGVKKSNERAMKWLRLANADDDHPEARTLMEKIARERRQK